MTAAFSPALSVGHLQPCCRYAVALRPSRPLPKAATPLPVQSLLIRLVDHSFSPVAGLRERIMRMLHYPLGGKAEIRFP